MFTNYKTHNWCDSCEHRFLKSTGYRCPLCNRRARLSPRTPADKNYPRI